MKFIQPKYLYLFIYLIINNNLFCYSQLPTLIPTIKPTTLTPTIKPTTLTPTIKPTTSLPTLNPTIKPTTSLPTLNPTFKPTTRNPTLYPSNTPTTRNPSKSPTKNPTKNPTTKNPSKIPTFSPSKKPTYLPTIKPSISPSKLPTLNPTNKPTNKPTLNPTNKPTLNPTLHPTNKPTSNPTNKAPINSPTISPTSSSETTIHLFGSDIPIHGNIGNNKKNIEQYCQSEVIGLLEDNPKYISSCRNIFAFLSYDINNYIGNIHIKNSFSLNSKVYSRFNENIYISTWEDLITTRNIFNNLTSLFDFGVFNKNIQHYNQPYNIWTGDDIFSPKTRIGNYNCNSWKSSSNKDFGNVGNFNKSIYLIDNNNNNWRGYSKLSCNDEAYLLCGCVKGPMLLTQNPTTKTPTTNLNSLIKEPRGSIIFFEPRKRILPNTIINNNNNNLYSESNAGTPELSLGNIGNSSITDNRCTIESNIRNLSCKNNKAYSFLEYSYRSIEQIIINDGGYNDIHKFYNPGIKILFSESKKEVGIINSWANFLYGFYENKNMGFNISLIQGGIFYNTTSLFIDDYWNGICKIKPCINCENWEYPPFLIKSNNKKYGQSGSINKNGLYSIDYNPGKYSNCYDIKYWLCFCFEGHLPLLSDIETPNPTTQNPTTSIPTYRPTYKSPTTNIPTTNIPTTSSPEFEIP